jgi:signal transduction histidine kinase
MYYGVIPDRRGRLWLSSNQGLLCYDTVQRDYRRYLPVDGLFGAEFNTGAFFRAADGRIWAGGFGGLAVFHPDSIRNVPFEPQVQMTRVLANDEPLETGRQAEVLESLDLPYAHNTLSFEFVALEFSNPKANQYQYRLVGYDDHWVKSGNRGFARYPNLPPGHYTFEVLAANSDGVWSTVPKSLNIHIQTPFYKTWWFYLLCTIAAIALVYAWFRYRLEQALKIERMRVQISSDLHDDVGTLLSGLAMQSEVLELTAPEKDKGKLRRIGEISRDAMTRMRDTVWAIDARKDKLENLLDRMREYAEETLAPRGIRFTIEAEHLSLRQNLPTHIRQNLYLIYKEAVTNAAKHSNGDTVSISLKKSGASFEMRICDNGTTEEKTWKTTGQGVSNMQMRAEKIGGQVEISRTDGYCVVLRLRGLG